MRQSFRQRRNTQPTNDRRKIAESLNLEAEYSSRKKQSKSVRPRADSEPASPVLATAGPPAEADSKVTDISRPFFYISAVLVQVSSELSGVVSSLCFADTHVAGGGTSPAIFASTMGSSIIRYSITLPDPRKRLSELNKAFVAGTCDLFDLFAIRSCRLYYLAILQLQ